MKKEKNNNWAIKQTVDGNIYSGHFVRINIEFVSDKFITKSLQKKIIKLLNFKNKPNQFK